MVLIASVLVHPMVHDIAVRGGLSAGEIPMHQGNWGFVVLRRVCRGSAVHKVHAATINASGLGKVQRPGLRGLAVAGGWPVAAVVAGAATTSAPAASSLLAHASPVGLGPASHCISSANRSRERSLDLFGPKFV
jgi:hypothetical protein